MRILKHLHHKKKPPLNLKKNIDHNTTREYCNFVNSNII